MTDIRAKIVSALKERGFREPYWLIAVTEECRHYYVHCRFRFGADEYISIRTREGTIDALLAAVLALPLPEQQRADAKPLCDSCKKNIASCYGTYEGHTGYGCDECCVHGSEDGHCEILDYSDGVPANNDPKRRHTAPSPASEDADADWMGETDRLKVMEYQIASDNGLLWHPGKDDVAYLLGIINKADDAIAQRLREQQARLDAAQPDQPIPVEQLEVGQMYECWWPKKARYVLAIWTAGTPNYWEHGDDSRGYFARAGVFQAIRKLTRPGFAEEAK